MRELRKRRFREAHEFSGLPHALFHRLLRPVGVERFERFGNDVRDPHARIEARVRVLEDHVEAASNVALEVGAPGRFFDEPFEIDASRGGLVEPREKTRERGFAAARFADKRERFAAPDAEGNAAHGLHFLLREP